MSVATHVLPDIVAIGASAGGVEAITALMRRLPADLPATVLIVLHRSPYEPSQLPKIIASATAMNVHVAEEGDPLEHGTCLIGPPARHLSITPELRIHLLADGFYRGHSIDALFQSLARCAGPRAIGIVLSGMLKDGTLGLRAIKEAGGLALVQTPSEAAFSEMPKSAIQFDGSLDLVGTVDELAEFVCRYLARVPVQNALSL